MIRQGRQVFGAKWAAEQPRGLVVALCPPMQSESGSSRSTGPAVFRQQIGCDIGHCGRQCRKNNGEDRHDDAFDGKDGGDDEVKHE